MGLAEPGAARPDFPKGASAVPVAPGGTPRSAGAARRQRRRLRLGVGIVLVVVLQLLAYQLWLSYLERIAAAETTTRNYAAIFATRLDATLRRTDAVLDELARFLPAAALYPHAADGDAGSRIDDELDTRRQTFDELIALQIVDRDGKLRYRSDQSTMAEVDLSGHDYFQDLRTRPAAEIAFSKVFAADDAEGRSTLVMTRPLRGDGGDFLAAVSAQLDLEPFRQIFRAVDLGRRGSIALRRSDDHRLVLGWPPGGEEANRTLAAQHPLRQRTGGGETTATLRLTAQSDGVDRIYSLQRLERYPFYFVIGISLDDVLDSWRSRTLVVAASVVLLLALLAVLLLRLWRSERREAETIANLVDSEQRLRTHSERLELFQRLAENAGQGIGMAHPEGSIIYANPALRQMLALPPDAACSSYSVDQFYANTNRQRWQREILPAVLATGQWTGELELAALDGRSIVAIHTLFVIRNVAGEPAIIANLLADVSERQEMEARNRQLLAEMQTLLGNAMVGIVHLRERRVIYCNRRIEEIFGFAPGELVGESSERFYASHEIFEEVGARAYATVAEGREFSTEMMLQRKDGSLFWGALTGRAIDASQPQQGSIWVFADVSERRQAEEDAQKLLQAVEQSPVAIVITNRDARIEYVNPSFTRASGYARAEAIGRNPGFLRSGDTPAETYRELWQTLLEGKVWSGLLHNRRKNGEPFWEQASISPVFGDDGQVTHYLAVKEDVSERRVTETRLRLLAGVFEHCAEAIMVSDRNNRILEVNRSFSRLTGYDADEVRGQDPRLLASGRSEPRDYQAMWQSIHTTGHWQGEIWDRRKDGSCYPKWLAISTIRSADGNIEYYIGSFVDISERKAAEEKISRLAHFDTLTQLPNRSNLQGRLDQALVAARRDGKSGPLAVMFLDLDRFKNINDTLGHHTGDALLLEVSQRLRASVRESDVVARLGGDEFVVVLTGANAVAAERVAAKMLAALSAAFHLDGHTVHTSSSIGIAVFPADGQTVDVLMRNADAAMYHAKAAGRNNIQFFTASMNESARDRRQIEEDLHQALKDDQFVLHYQAQFDAGGRASGAEALLRWQHPEQGLVPPPRFIPLAEDSGLIVPIGQWVLEAACTQLRAWSAKALTGKLQLAVNVSARQFRQADFVDRLDALLRRSGIAPAQLKLELTESLVLDNAADTIAKMNAIKTLGVGFAMDDFGTGYSSLSYLTSLPLDQLKIDRAFVSRLPDSHSDAVVAQTIISMGHSLGLKVIAEGVETDAQRSFLDAHGCDGYQGFLFSRPLPAAEFEHYLASLPGPPASP